MLDEDKQAVAPAVRGWTRALLIGSVALNLLFVGVVVGAGVSRTHGPDRGARDLGFGIIGEALSPEDQRALRRAALRQTAALREMRGQGKADAERLFEALRADPFAPEALSEALRTLAAGLTLRQDFGEALLRARIEEMTPEQRRGFADRLENVMARRAPSPRG